MTIFYRAAFLEHELPAQLTQIPMLSPLQLRGTELQDSYFVTLSLPTISASGGILGLGTVFIRLLGGGNVLSELTWGPGSTALFFHPVLCGAGDIINRAGREVITAEWQVLGAALPFRADGPCSLTAVVDRKG